MHEIEYTSQAIRFLRKSPSPIANRIRDRIHDLKTRPIPPDAKFLGRDEGDPIYRVRVGDYRVLYCLFRDHILITKIDKRDRVYNRNA